MADGVAQWRGALRGRWSASLVSSVLVSSGWFAGSMDGGGGAVWQRRGARGNQSDRFGGWSTIEAREIESRLR